MGFLRERIAASHLASQLGELGQSRLKKGKPSGGTIFFRRKLYRTPAGVAVVPLAADGSLEPDVWERYCSGAPFVEGVGVEVLGDDLLTARESVAAQTRSLWQSEWSGNQGIHS